MKVENHIILVSWNTNQCYVFFKGFLMIVSIGLSEVRIINGNTGLVIYCYL
jgi:hypothetical protein